MCGYFCIGFIDCMLAGKKLTDYTNLFSPHDLKKKTICLISKMNKNNSIENISIKNNSLETIDETVLSEQKTFGFSEIIGIENYFYQEINQRKSCSKKLNKYGTNFDYIDKILF